MKIQFSDALLEPRAFPAVTGLELSDATSRPGLPVDRPGLAVWQQEFPEGGKIVFSGPQEDHVLYVVEGQLRMGERSVVQEGVISVGRNARVEIEADAGTLLIHYVGDAATRPDKPGGCVHVLSDQGLLRFEDEREGYHRVAILYADSDCPNCSVWLHKQNNAAGKFTYPHSHSVDEIINILEGDLIFGVRTFSAGASIAVQKDAFYSFRTGPRGLVFLNFRQDDPTHLRKGADPSTAKHERSMWQREVAQMAATAAAKAEASAG